MRPSLDLSVEVKDASGTVTRWGSEDHHAETIPRGITFGTQRMQGFGGGGVTLSRRVDQDYVDIHLLDDVTFVGGDGSVAYEGRVGAIPRSASPEHSLSLQLTGHMAVASDRTFTQIYVDRDLGHLTNPSAAWIAVNMGNDYGQEQGTVQPDVTTGFPCLRLSVRGGWVSPYKPMCTSMYDAGSCFIDSVYVDWQPGPYGVDFNAPWQHRLYSSNSDDQTGIAMSENNTPLQTAGYHDAQTTRFIFFEMRYDTTPGGADGATYSVDLRNIALYGNHGLTLHGSDPGGVYASDVIANIVARYCPTLKTAITDTSWVIPHLTFLDQTKPYDAFLAVNAYHLWELAVWENKTLHYGPSDLTDYDWEIRLDEPGTTLDLQGDSTQDLANGVTVQFTNVETGQQQFLSPADYDELTDANVENPANTHGLSLWTPYQLSIPTTLASALQIGRAALAEYNAPKAPGSITVSHHVKDRAGHYQPVWKVRAGDRVAITSSGSLSDRPRLVHETSYEHESKTMTIAVDSERRTLGAVVDRMSTALQAAGLT